VLTSDNDKKPNQKKRYIPPGGTSLSFDADAIYFGDGSALKVPDGSIWIIYDCNALQKWNGSKPALDGIGPYKVKFLPKPKDQEKEFGPIVPADPCKKCPQWIKLRHTGENDGVGVVPWGLEEQDGSAFARVRGNR
jgi:hypothetical protein